MFWQYLYWLCDEDLDETMRCVNFMGKSKILLRLNFNPEDWRFFYGGTNA